MEETPRKHVEWGLDISLSELASPGFSNISSESMASTSSLQYINSQLVAHGFSNSPGLSLDGLSNSDSERVVKCLLAMLGQRVEDMSRTEDLTTKLRTLSYDHERLASMHRAATDKAASAEREMNLHKTKLAAANRSLQSTESAHKHTTAELQRTRTTLQGVRATYQTELKKKEKDIERMVEKWSKLAEAQVKLGTTPSSLRCANVTAVDGSVAMGPGKSYLEQALEQAERARKELSDDNQRLRKLVLTAVNDVQAVLHMARSIVSSSEDEPASFTMTTVFPLAPEYYAEDKLASLLCSLRESIVTLSENVAVSSSTPPPQSKPSKSADDEIERLQAVVNTLRADLVQAQKESAASAVQTQAMFDQFAADQRVVTADLGEMSVELMTGPAKDEERNRLDALKRELDQERSKFTEAAIKLGKEKAAIEAERVKFLDEKRSWQVEMMLADLPPTPQVESPARSKVLAAARRSPRKSPHKSPMKKTVAVGKAGSGRKTRVSRRSSVGLASPAKVVPGYETEVLPPIPAPSFPAKNAGASHSFLPTSFVLPPPSPATSLPPPRPLISSSIIPPAPENIPLPKASADELVPAWDAKLQPASGLLTPSVARHPFPVAKPFARGMNHAYSPAKPSPLSRILMLADSPTSPQNSGTRPLDVLTEESEDSMAPEPFPAISTAAKSLAAELGVSDDDTSPLREKKVEPNPNVGTKVFRPPEPKRLTSKEKGKGRAPEPVAPGKRRSTEPQKENDTKRSRSTATAMKLPPADSKKLVRPAGKPVESGLSKPRVIPRIAPGNGGPRRVPIDSAEAAPKGRGWKG
ncbi:hypothetical protein PLICRDRAFT_115132 [Plicaturopsis crispa FD-325 SS-3]|nr:hypothetical protein PLICRDRAFT_115132 [Plicaturopsis crispa FD-325 SS-3]